MLVLDIALPAKTESLRVDRHTINSRRSRSGDGIEFIGDTVPRCSADYSTYGKRKDGDTVDVPTIKLLHHCLRITQGDALLVDEPHWKFIRLLGSAAMIASAIALIRDHTRI